jgi:hypothetical protein
MDHGVQVVGFEILQKEVISGTVDSWQVRNSWGQYNRSPSRSVMLNHVQFRMSLLEVPDERSCLFLSHCTGLNWANNGYISLVGSFGQNNTCGQFRSTRGDVNTCTWQRDAHSALALLFLPSI